MSVEFYRESPGKFDSWTLSRKTLSRWTGRITTQHIPLPQLRRQRELPRTSEVCPYIVKDLILRTSDVFVPRG